MLEVPDLEVKLEGFGLKLNGGGKVLYCIIQSCLQRICGMSRIERK